ncbi:MAG: PDZ domain-containing protein [Deltaproteobacteria bacterium]|nr:PDZ domain-containing protein [Deltaproteobacteria bacterium]
MRGPRRLVVLLFASLVGLAGSVWAQSPAGFIGLVCKPVTRDLARANGLQTNEGAHVVEVVPGSPAAIAGIREGDIVIDLDGRKVADPEILAERVASRSPGARATVEVVRHRQRIRVTVVVSSPRSGPPRSDLPKAVLGAVRAKS